MGNQNLYQDQNFMAKYKKLQSQFTSQVPLFDTQKIKFPLSTSGMKIVDKTGKRVKLAGGNWSGGHAQRHCVSGLQYRRLQDLCRQIRQKFDMNCIRLTFSLQMFYKNNKISQQFVKANPQLNGKTSMEIFDETIKALTKAGIMVILNNHTSKSQWCCTPWDGDGLWYTQQYPEEKFFQCLKQMAIRYKNNPLVIGMDLRNQIRSNWFTKPTWGTKVKQTDWHMASQKIGNQLQQIAPHWLIIVGGIDSQLDLTDILQHPIKLKISNKLVYSGHFYAFSWLTYLPTWKLRSQEGFRQNLFNRQMYVRALDQGVPFLLGQFGSNQQDIPWNYLIRYLKQFDIDWCYWCLDGYKCRDMQDESFGMWTRHYDGIRQPELLKDLHQIGRPKKNRYE